MTEERKVLLEKLKRVDPITYNRFEAITLNTLLDMRIVDTFQSR